MTSQIFFFICICLGYVLTIYVGGGGLSFLYENASKENWKWLLAYLLGISRIICSFLTGIKRIIYSFWIGLSVDLQYNNDSIPKTSSSSSDTTGNTVAVKAVSKHANSKTKSLPTPQSQDKSDESKLLARIKKIYSDTKDFGIMSSSAKRFTTGFISLMLLLYIILLWYPSLDSIMNTRISGGNTIWGLLVVIITIIVLLLSTACSGLPTIQYFRHLSQILEPIIPSVTNLGPDYLRYSAKPSDVNALCLPAMAAGRFIRIMFSLLAQSRVVVFIGIITMTVIQVALMLPNVEAYGDNSIGFTTVLYSALEMLDNKSLGITGIIGYFTAYIRQIATPPVIPVIAEPTPEIVPTNKFILAYNYVSGTYLGASVTGLIKDFTEVLPSYAVTLEYGTNTIILSGLSFGISVLIKGTIAVWFK